MLFQKNSVVQISSVQLEVSDIPGTQAPPASIQKMVKEVVQSYLPLFAWIVVYTSRGL